MLLHMANFTLGTLFAYTRNNCEIIPTLRSVFVLSIETSFEGVPGRSEHRAVRSLKTVLSNGTARRSEAGIFLPLDSWSGWTFTGLFSPMMRQFTFLVRPWGIPASVFISLPFERPGVTKKGWLGTSWEHGWWRRGVHLHQGQVLSAFAWLKIILLWMGLINPVSYLKTGNPKLPVQVPPFPFLNSRKEGPLLTLEVMGHAVLKVLAHRPLLKVDSDKKQTKNKQKTHKTK